MKNKLVSLLVGLSVSLLVLVSSSIAQIPRFYGEEIVVTALRIPRLKSSIPWNTKVITRKEIEESAAVKLGDILRSVSGVAVKSNGGLSSQLSARLRGSNSQQVLVLLNGSRINSPSLGTFDLGDILLADVEKIEVVTAPLSALYGADAVGGVVNVITRKGSAKPKTEVIIGFGEFATQNLAVSSSCQNYFFSAASLKSNGFRDNADYKAEDYSLRLFGEMGLAKVEAGVKKYQADKGSPGSLDFLTPQARQKDENLFYDIIYRADRVGLKITASRSILDQQYENPSWALLSTHKTDSSIYDLQQTITWFPEQTIMLGAELRKDSSASTNSGNHELSNKAVYFQDEIDLGESTTIVIGGREDINSVYGHHFNPRIGFVYDIFSDTKLKASWGSSFRAPTIDDLYWSKTTEPGWPSGVITTEGNINLNPEQAQSVDITLEKKLNPQSTARVSYFQSAVTDMIRWGNISTSTINAYWTPTNVTNATIQGVEFEFEKQIYDNMDGFVNLTYQNVKDKNSDKFLDYSPQSQYNAGLTHRSSRGLVTNFLVRYVGERYTDLANTNKLPSYTVIDLALSQKIGRWMLKGNVENLFNESYAESYGFIDVYPMAGRRYNIAVSTKI